MLVKLLLAGGVIYFTLFVLPTRPQSAKNGIGQLICLAVIICLVLGFFYDIYRAIQKK